MVDRKHFFPRTFQPTELIFDEEETKDILKFFFVDDHSYIEGIDINDRLKSLAQSLLIEAVDASFAMGFVEIIYDTFYLKPPTPKIRKIFAKLGKKAATHWFKVATANDLSNIKIYESVRRTIERNFRRHFKGIAEGLVMKKPVVAVVAYNKASNMDFVWAMI